MIVSIDITEKRKEKVRIQFSRYEIDELLIMIQNKLKQTTNPCEKETLTNLHNKLIKK
jgi:hypothetical protein